MDAAAEIDPGHLARFTAGGMEPADRIAVTVDIEAAADAVWQVISAPGNLADVHPFCARNDVDRWPGIGSRDHVRYFSGIHYEREALGWEVGRGYALAVGPPSGATALASWAIEPGDGDECTFELAVVPFVRTDVAPASRAAYRRNVVEGALPPYVDAVARGVRHFVETGEPVGRNRFGPHPLFSPDRPT